MIRGTYEDYDYPLKLCYEDLLKLGAKEINILPDLINISTDDIEKLLLQMDILKEYVVDYAGNHDDFPFGLVKRRIRDLFIGSQDGHGRNCGAGKNVFAVDLQGNIFPCHRFSGQDNMKLGNVLEKCKNVSLKQYEHNCEKCWNKKTCNKMCLYESYLKNETGNTLSESAFCKFSQKLTEIAIDICGELDEVTLLKIIK